MEASVQLKYQVSKRLSLLPASAADKNPLLSGVEAWSWSQVSEGLSTPSQFLHDRFICLVLGLSQFTQSTAYWWSFKLNQSLVFVYRGLIILKRLNVKKERQKKERKNSSATAITHHFILCACSYFGLLLSCWIRDFLLRGRMFHRTITHMQPLDECYWLQLLKESILPNKSIPGKAISVSVYFGSIFKNLRITAFITSVVLLA